MLTAPDTPDSELEQRVRELEGALEAADEAICRVGVDGRIASANRACEALWGHAAADILGRSWEELIAPADRGPLRADLRAHGRGKVERELHGVHKDGNVFAMRLTSVPVESGGPGTPAGGYYFFMRDLTERRRMENQLIFAGRMAAVGTLAAGVAHEINNPLAYIAANIDYSRRRLAAVSARTGRFRGRDGDGDADDDLPRALEEIEEALGEARQGAERVRHIVRDLRVFARGDDETSGPVELRRVLESSINMAYNEIRHRARMVKDFADVPMVEGNESRLGQVFLNLLLNAAHAIAEGDSERNEIRVSTRSDEAGRAVVEVRDTGRGIPAGIQARIFDPFFTTKPAGEGTGLGLWICQGILSGLGGKISVESEVGRGSVFRVVLPPLAVEAPPLRTRTPPPEAARRGGRVLIVDDEPMILGALRRALIDYEVVCVGDGRQALEQLRAGERFDVILCDLMMPELTGMDLYTELASIPTADPDRIIFVTGGAFTARAREFLDRVPNARVEKPIDFQSLRLLIRNLIR
jgi:PAS domain S-box-containing protein